MLLKTNIIEQTSRHWKMQNNKTNPDFKNDEGTMNHPMPLFYLPQFQSQPVPPVQVQIPNVQQPPRLNMPSETVMANRRCDICNKVFSTPGNCSIHKKKHTGENEKVQCDDCGKNFSTPGNLAIHKRIHSGEKAVKCDVCDKEFLHSGNLTVHKRIHSGEKAVKCEICHKLFSHSGNLTIHMRRHTFERPFKCSECGKGFSHSGNLHIHMRRHTGEKPYKCEICHKEFSYSGGLTIHTRIHTGERPYKCEICGKEFSHSGNKTIHMRKHTGEKPFRCQLCDSSFSHSGNLTIHMIKHVDEAKSKNSREKSSISKPRFRHSTAGLQSTQTEYEPKATPPPTQSQQQHQQQSSQSQQQAEQTSSFPTSEQQFPNNAPTPFNSLNVYGNKGAPAVSLNGGPLKTEYYNSKELTQTPMIYHRDSSSSMLQAGNFSSQLIRFTHEKYQSDAKF